MSESYAAKVRPYTTEEAASIERPDGETVEQKMARRELTHKIDVMRYVSAAYAHEELTFHMIRMAEVGARALEGWKRFYNLDVSEVPQSQAAIIGYGGTEGHHDVPRPVMVPVGMRADLPA